MFNYKPISGRVVRKTHYLYHFTKEDNFAKILESGLLKACDENGYRLQVTLACAGRDIKQTNQIFFFGKQIGHLVYLKTQNI